MCFSSGITNFATRGQNRKTQPTAANVLMHDMFIDITETYSNEVALICQTQMISLCVQGNFQLWKWTSNLPTIFQLVPTSDCSI